MIKLPDFDKPPVVEVALTAQFEPLAACRAAHFGLFWKRVRDRFPKVEEHAPAAHFLERFGTDGSAPEVRFDFALLGQQPVQPTRAWFVTESGAELIQLQNDRLSHNWRKQSPADVYPRYESIREPFANELRSFAEFAASEGLGDLKFDQCEVLYINFMQAVDGESSIALERFLRVFQPAPVENEHQQLEQGRVNLRYTLTDSDHKKIGRLHVVAYPAFNRKDRSTFCRLDLTARGEPLGGADIDAVLRFLDLGRAAIVRTFADITTPEMHKLWERKDDRHN